MVGEKSGRSLEEKEAENVRGSNLQLLRFGEEEVILDLSKIKSYLKVDCNDDDNLIGDLCLAAEEYLSSAEVEKNYDKELYSLAIKLLVSHWYYNRMILDEKTQAKLPFSLDDIIKQLSL